MKNYKLPYFEEIDLNNAQEEYETEIEFNNNEVDIFLNEVSSLNNEELNFIKTVLENLTEFDKKNREFITDDFNKNGETFEYLSYYLEEDYAEDFKDLILPDDTEINNLKRLKNSLKITTISAYSDCIVFDYCLNDEISDQILGVKIDSEKIISINWES